jgi:hypothetical protein
MATICWREWCSRHQQWLQLRGCHSKRVLKKLRKLSNLIGKSSYCKTEICCRHQRLQSRRSQTLTENNNGTKDSNNQLSHLWWNFYLNLKNKGRWKCRKRHLLCRSLSTTGTTMRKTKRPSVWAKARTLGKDRSKKLTQQHIQLLLQIRSTTTKLNNTIVTLIQRHTKRRLLKINIRKPKMMSLLRKYGIEAPVLIKLKAQNYYWVLHWI